jgi:hypothetical protein
MPDPTTAEMQQILQGAMTTALTRFIRAAGGMIQVKLDEIDTGAAFDFRVANGAAFFVAREPPKPPQSRVVLAPAGALDRLNGTKLVR